MLSPLEGGGAKLNIDYGQTPPADTSKLWVPLSGKPDKVECKPASLSGSEFFESVVATSGVLSYNVGPKAYFQFGEYVYFYHNTTTFIRLNINEAAAETVNIRSVFTNLTVLDNGSGFCQNGNIVYIVTTGCNVSGSSYSNTSILACNLSTKQASRLGTLVGDAETNGVSQYSAIEYCNGNLYIAGGLRKSYANTTNTVKIFDLSTNTSRSAYTMTHSAANLTMTAIGSNIYIFGGAHQTDIHQQVYKIDTVNNTITTVATYPVTCFCMSSFAVGNNIYLFGGAVQSIGANPTGDARALSSIYKFNTQTNAFSLLPISLTSGQYYSVIYNSDLYCYVIKTEGDSSAKTKAKFVVNVPLDENTLLIQEDYGTDSLWSALKSKDTDLKVKVINAYLGDSNNIAQLTNAYLYDRKDLKWKSLSGESYVADMQNALNILGVT